MFRQIDKGITRLLVATNVRFSSVVVSIMVIFSLHQSFHFEGRGIKLQPLFINRLRNTLRVDTGGLQPFLDRIDAVLMWSKQIMDLFYSIVLAITR